jgi:hypothetical protein
MDSAGGSASTLAMAYSATQRAGPAVLGPALFEDMGEAALVAALNAWGGAMHSEVLALRADLGATQVAVSSAFVQAQDAVSELVAAFRVEVVAMRQAAAWEAQQSLARLQHVVEEARVKFDLQDARFTSGLVELAQRLQAADAWAQAEPTRIAAAVGVPVPGWLTPPRAGVGRMGSPGHAAPHAGGSRRSRRSSNRSSRRSRRSSSRSSSSRRSSPFPRRPASAASAAQALAAARAATRRSCASLHATGATAANSTSP